MSIWVSRLIMDDEWPDALPSPLVYHASHLFPTAVGDRGGYLETAHIPAFLAPDYEDAEDGEDVPFPPFLRLSIDFAVPNDRAVILDVAQVDALIADLTDWRAGVDEERA